MLLKLCQFGKLKLKLIKLKKEAEAEKKAIIEANVIKDEKGKRIIKVYNKGKFLAKNVIVTFSDEPNISFMDYPKSIDLRPQNSMEIIFYAFMGSPNILEINFKWEDGIKKDNQDSQIIQF